VKHWGLHLGLTQFLTRGRLLVVPLGEELGGTIGEPLDETLSDSLRRTLGHSLGLVIRAALRETLSWTGDIYSFVQISVIHLEGHLGIYWDWYSEWHWETCLAGHLIWSSTGYSMWWWCTWSSGGTGGIG
jgi:hypothetical protein